MCINLFFIQNPKNNPDARIVTNCSVEENTQEESMKSEKSYECKICHNLFQIGQVGTFKCFNFSFQVDTFLM